MSRSKKPGWGSRRGGKRYCWIPLICLAPWALRGEMPEDTQLRRVRLGDTLEPFTLADIDGKRVSWQSTRERVSVIVFLAAYQKRSERAITESVDVVSRLQRQRLPLDLVAVISGGEGLDYFRKLRKDLELAAPLLVDREDELWGRLGLVVTPTVVVTDGEGKIRWIRAGHGYDFSGELRTRLAGALGLEKHGEDGSGREVEVLVSGTATDRARRHLKLGQLLSARGKVESALAEIRKAEALTPSAVDVQLQLGQLLCRAGKAEEALEVLGKIRTAERTVEAELKMASGWACRQLGRDQLAAQLLEESVRLNPKLVRALYELGKVYEKQGEKEKALEVYRRALAVHFDEPLSPPGQDSGQN